MVSIVFRWQRFIAITCFFLLGLSSFGQKNFITTSSFISFANSYNTDLGNSYYSAEIVSEKYNAGINTGSKIGYIHLHKNEWLEFGFSASLFSHEFNRDILFKAKDYFHGTDYNVHLSYSGNSQVLNTNLFIGINVGFGNFSIRNRIGLAGQGILDQQISNFNLEAENTNIGRINKYLYGNSVEPIINYNAGLYYTKGIFTIGTGFEINATRSAAINSISLDYNIDGASFPIFQSHIIDTYYRMSQAWIQLMIEVPSKNRK